MTSGGGGPDTLRFIINDQNPLAEQAFIAEFRQVEAAFDQAARQGHPGTFDIDGLHVTSVERIELQIVSVSTNPNTPYLITHQIAMADGRGGHESSALQQLLQTVEVAVAEHEAQTASIASQTAAVVTSSGYGQNVRVLFPRSARANELLAGSLVFIAIIYRQAFNGNGSDRNSLRHRD